MNNRDIDILERIIMYCSEIKEAQDRFGSTLEALESDSLYRNAIAMCILQIGELVIHFTDDFKDSHNAIPWHKIRGMRNIAAHHYGKFDVNIMFNTITERMPELRDYCSGILRESRSGEGK